MVYTYTEKSLSSTNESAISDENLKIAVMPSMFCGYSILIYRSKSFCWLRFLHVLLFVQFVSRYHKIRLAYFSCKHYLISEVQLVVSFQFRPELSFLE